MSNQMYNLTHWGRVTHIYVDNLTIIAWLVAWSAPSFESMLEYFIWTLRNKLQWNFIRNAYIFIQESAFENVVCKMAAPLSRPQFVKSYIIHRVISSWYAPSDYDAIYKLDTGRDMLRPIPTNTHAGKFLWDYLCLFDQFVRQTAYKM